MKQKQVQIPLKTLFSLLNYFLVEPREEDRIAIEKALNEKLEALIRHDLYTKSKTLPTEEEREKARQEYLDRISMHRDFRW